MSFAASNIDVAIQQILDAIAADPLTPYTLDKAIGKNEVKRLDVKPPRVAWEPLYDDGYRDPHEQPDDGHAIYETTTYCDVYAWGKDLLEATKLRDAVLRQGWTVFSPNAFKAPVSGRQPYTAGARQNDLGIRIRFTVGFVIPIYDELWTHVATNTATSNLSVTDPTGSSPEALQ